MSRWRQESAYVLVTAATYTCTASDFIIGVNRAGAVTITIPTLDITKGRRYGWFIKDESGAAGTNNITIATEGSETIDGAGTLVISANYGGEELYTNGTNLFRTNI
jgi:hypothetical protein